jgi:hypothetical protein
MSQQDKGCIDALYALGFVHTGLLVLQITGMVMLPIASSEWFHTFPSYRFWIPTVVALILVEMGIHAIKTESSGFRLLYKALLLIWILLPLAALFVWLWIEMFWWCGHPSHTDYYCWDKVNGQLNMGYLVFAIATLIQWPGFIAQYVCFHFVSREQFREALKKAKAKLNA